MILAISKSNNTLFLTEYDEADPTNTVTYMLYEDESVWENVNTPRRTMDEVRMYHAGWHDEILHDGDFPCV